MNKTIFFISLLFSVGIYSCNNCNHDLIKGVNTKANWYRFDSSFYSLNETTDFADKLRAIKDDDSMFYDLYLSKLFNINTNDPKALGIIYKHINSAQNQAIRKRVDSLFGDFSKIYKEVDLLAKYFEYYYPERNFPTIHTCYSGIAGFMAWIYTDSSLLLDLDMYLGVDFEAYPQFFPAYKYAYFTQDYIAQNIGKELIRREYLVLEQNKPKNMLEMMLVEAAKVHDLKNIMPCREPYKLMEYTKEQWEWLLAEEPLIWQYFAKENLLMLPTDVVFI